MMGEWGEFGLVAAGVALATLTGFLLLARRRPAAARLADGGDDARSEFELPALTAAVGDGLPTGKRDLAEIQPELLRAGFYSPSSLARYKAVRALLIVAPLVVAGVVCLAVPTNRMPVVAVVGVGAAALGYSLPRVYLAARARARARQVEHGLPVFADLLTLALLAEQNVFGGLRRVAAEIRMSYPVVAEELDLVVKQGELESLVHAFERWADRSQVPDVRTLAVVVSQAQRMGTDITAALMEYSNNVRANIRQRADAQAQRAGLWMLFPNILCLWIPAAVILVAPMAFEFQARRAKAKEAIKQNTKAESLDEAVERANGPSRGPAPAAAPQPGR